MRIALALHGWPPAAMGGTGLYVDALAGALQAAGHTVALLAPGEGSRIELRAVLCAHGTIAHQMIAPPLTRWEHTWQQPGRARLIEEWLDLTRPEVLHVHHLSGLPWGLVEAARARGIRTVLTLHDYALPCARGQLVNREGARCPGPAPGRCAVCLREQLGLSPVRAALGRLLTRFPRARTAARRGAAVARARAGDEALMLRRNTALQELFLSFDQILSPSADLARRVHAMGLGASAGGPVRLCALPLLQAVPVAHDPGVGPLRFLFASALIPTKGPERLLEAFARLPPGLATLTLVGPAPPYDGAPGFAARLRARAREIPGVDMPGEVASGQMGALLGRHDVLVLPSLWPENSPLVLREATAAGLRVIAGAEGGAGELDPLARLVPPAYEDGGALLSALQAEIQLGRGRRPPLRWPDPETHAAWLLSEVYL